MIVIGANTAAAIALHAAEGSWVMFLQAIYPPERRGPIKVEGLRGASLAERLISISRDCPCEVQLIGLLSSPIDPIQHANEIATELTAIHSSWFAPTEELTSFIENSAQAPILELLGRTQAGAIDGLMSIDEIAEYLSVSVPTVRRMIKDRRIPYLRFGRIYRFVPNEVVASLRTEAGYHEEA